MPVCKQAEFPGGLKQAMELNDELFYRQQQQQHPTSNTLPFSCEKDLLCCSVRNKIYMLSTQQFDRDTIHRDRYTSRAHPHQERYAFQPSIIRVDQCPFALLSVPWTFGLSLYTVNYRSFKTYHPYHLASSQFPSSEYPFCFSVLQEGHILQLLFRLGRNWKVLSHPLELPCEPYRPPGKFIS